MNIYNDLNKVSEVVRLHRMTAMQPYKEIVNIVKDHGEHKPKKHGEWIKLQYTKDIYFTLDSWSNALWIRKGKGEYCYVTGFGRDDESIYIGIGFGEYDIHHDREILMFWYENLCRAMEKN